MAVLVAGTLALATPAPQWGDTVTFDVSHDAQKGRVYVTVVCFQGEDLVLQHSTWEQKGWAVPLADQPGGVAAGLTIDPSQPGTCEAHLIHRVKRQGEDTITTLDVVTFTVQPG